MIKLIGEGIKGTNKKQKEIKETKKRFIYKKAHRQGADNTADDANQITSYQEAT